MADFTIKRNDTLPKIEATLQQNSIVYDLTGATVKFIMKKSGSGAAKVDASATVVDASGGQVEYAWDDVAGDTDTEGDYNAEFEVTTGSGEILTFPNGADGTDYITIEITEDLA